MSLFKDLATRPEVFFLMVRYSGKDYFAKDDLHFFLEGEQVKIKNVVKNAQVRNTRMVIIVSPMVF